MAAKPLEEVLEKEPYRFEFFQAVRVLEKLHPEKKAVGREALPLEEVVRFGSNVTLDFPASEINEIRVETDEENGSVVRRMLVNFMGMVGSSGVLPAHYTELVLDRIRHRDRAMWSFLDIFTHRAVSMFYRAWGKYRFPTAYERGDDDFTKYLFDLIGMGTNGLRGRLALTDEALLPYSGLIAQRPHSTNALENILSDHFSMKAKVKQFHGQWLRLDTEDLTRLGQNNSELGTNALAGSQIWDQQSKMRLYLGPLKFDQFQAFLPNGSAHESLKSIIRIMIGDEFDYDIQLSLDKKQLPGSILTTRAKRRPQLGWTSYLKTVPAQKDDDQLVLAVGE